jgi:pilus assembly protein CpaE
MPGLDGVEVLSRLQASERTRKIPVMMVTALGQDENVSQCLDAGAIDHVAKPFSAVVIRARVRAALRNRVQRKRGKLIGFIGAKGGVGNTTAVVNTAFALTTPERSVAVVELRPYFGTLAQQIGLTAARNLQPLLEDRPDGALTRDLEKHLTAHPSGLKALLAPPSIDDEREFTADQAQAILRGLVGGSDFVLADLPFPPTTATRAALELCDFVVVTIALEPGCLPSAKLMLETLHAWDVPDLKLGALLVIQKSSTASISVSDARQQLKCQFVGVIPPALDLCLTADRTGVPLVLAAPQCPAATAFTEFSSRLIPDRVQTIAF